MTGLQAEVTTTLGVHALGTLRVADQGVEVRLGGPRQRRLLAVLLIHRGAVVSVDRIAEAVFAGAPTEAASTTLRSYVARLRRVLGEEAVETRAPGYRLALPAHTFDVARFEQGVASARTAQQRQDPAAAAELVGAALALWQGDAYAEFADEEWAYAEAQRLAEVRLSALELRVEAELARGRAVEVLPEIEGLCRKYPLREAFRGLLMTAYYRSGRQADALAAFRAFREELADELGIDPGPALVELERRILAQDPELAVTHEELRGYQLGERLGTGRDGTVHAARLPGLERALVIKTLRPEMADDPDFIRAFEATARGVASLRHPAVAPIRDYWREPGAAYVVLPRLSGGTLADRLRQGQLSPAHLRVLVERIGGALLAASDAGLAHGRLTTDNVLYDDDLPVLTDFWLGGEPAPDASADVRGLAEIIRAAAVRAGADVDSSLVSGLGESESVGDLVVRVLEALGDDTRQPALRANPYQGLQAFDEADAANYFGRAELIEEVVARLVEGSRLILLVGASGTGKSSAVRAGVLPALRVDPRTRDWFVASMLPAGAPYAELARAIDQIAVTPTAGLAERMAAAGEAGIDDALRRMVPGSGQLLLVLDQFEELFTLSSDDEQRAFLAALTHALTVPDCRLRVVATLRADFYDRPLGIQPFGSMVGEATVPIPAMLPAELEAAVVEPARRVGGEVERALAAELVGIMATEPTGLPALQFVLYELAERSRDGHLTLRAYRELGGLEGAIAARAEQLYEALDDTDRQLVRELFERLVVVGDGEPTRRRATREEVRAADELVDAWAASRLLSIDVHVQTRVPTVEVAHEALVREWPRLRAWLEADRTELVVLSRVRDAALTWAEDERDPSELMRGTTLVAALEVAARRTHLPELEREYVEASRIAADSDRIRQGRALRRLRTQVLGIAVLLVLALLGGFVALDQRREAVQQGHLATARELAAAANESLREDPERSMLLALAAVDETRRTGDEVLPEAQEALHRAVSSNRLLRTFSGQGGALDWSDNGRYFATEGPEETGKLDIRDAQTGTSVRAWRAEEFDVNDVAFSPDSRRIASVGDEGVLRVWDVQTGEKVSEAGGNSPHGFAPQFSPDGRMVAAMLPNQGQALIVDVETGRVRARLEAYGVGLAWSPDGKRIAVTRDFDMSVVVFDVASSKEVLELSGLDTPSELAWSPDGKWLAAAQSAHFAVIFDARTGERRFQTYGHSGGVNGVAWAPSSAQLATASNDGTVRVFDVGESFLSERLVLSGQSLRNGARAVEYGPDGRELMTADWGITATQVWNVTEVGGGEVGNFRGRTSSDRAAGFTPDSRSIWIAGAAGSATRYDLVTGRSVQGLPSRQPRSQFGHQVMLSPDGTLLAVLPVEGPVAVYDVATEEIAFEVAEDSYGELDAAWSPDSRHLAVAASDEVQIVDRGGRTVSRWRNEHFIGSMTFVDDGRLVATTVDPDPGHPAGRSIVIRDWETGRQVRRIVTSTAYLAAPPTGSLLVSSRFFEGVVDVWDVTTGQRVALLEGHAGQVTGVAFDARGDRVATAGADASARVWDARTGELLSALRGPLPVGSGGVAFSPDGKRLLTTWDDSVTRVWTLDIEELVRIGRGRLTRDLTPAECERYLHQSACPAFATGLPQA